MGVKFNKRPILYRKSSVVKIRPPFLVKYRSKRNIVKVIHIRISTQKVKILKITEDCLIYLFITPNIVFNFDGH